MKAWHLFENVERKLNINYKCRCIHKLFTTEKKTRKFIILHRSESFDSAYILFWMMDLLIVPVER